MITTTVDLTALKPILAQAVPTSEKMISDEVVVFMALKQVYRREERCYRSLIVLATGKCLISERTVETLFVHLQQRLDVYALIRIRGKLLGFKEKVPYVVGREAYLRFNKPAQRIWVGAHHLDDRFKTAAGHVTCRLINGLRLSLPVDISFGCFQHQLDRAVTLQQFGLFIARERVGYYGGWLQLEIGAGAGYLWRHLRNDQDTAFKSYKWYHLLQLEFMEKHICNIVLEQDKVLLPIYQRKLEAPFWESMSPVMRREMKGRLEKIS